MASTVISKHSDVEIRFDADDGLFRAQLGDRRLTDKALAGLKKKIDNFRRVSVRAEAANLPTLLLETDWYAVDNDDYPENTREAAKWRSGVFFGLNAHTGEVSVAFGNHAAETVHSSAWFFRPGDPAIEVIKTAVAERIAAAKAFKAAKRKLQDSLRKYGFQISLPYRSRGEAATTAALDAETRLIAFLKGGAS